VESTTASVASTTSDAANASSALVGPRHKVAQVTRPARRRRRRGRAAVLLAGHQSRHRRKAVGVQLAELGRSPARVGAANVERTDIYALPARGTASAPRLRIKSLTGSDTCRALGQSCKREGDATWKRRTRANVSTTAWKPPAAAPPRPSASSTPSGTGHVNATASCVDAAPCGPAAAPSALAGVGRKRTLAVARRRRAVRRGARSYREHAAMSPFAHALQRTAVEKLARTQQASVSAVRAQTRAKRT